MTIKIIYAQSENNIFGIDNKLPWNIPEELIRFKNKTFGDIVVMGRKTWDSLPFKPLKGRINIVVTRNESFLETYAVSDIRKVIDEYPDKTIWIIGGSELITTSLPLADEIHRTIINKNVEGNIVAPYIDLNEWSISSSTTFSTSSGVSFTEEILNKTSIGTINT